MATTNSTYVTFDMPSLKNKVQIQYYLTHSLMEKKRPIKPQNIVASCTTRYMQVYVPILGIKSLSLTFAMKVLLLLLLLLLLNLIQTPLSQ